MGILKNGKNQYRRDASVQYIDYIMIIPSILLQMIAYGAVQGASDELYPIDRWS